MKTDDADLVHRSIHLKAQGDHAGALALLDEAIRGGQDVARAQYQRGLTLAEMDRVDEAVEAYRRAIEARPDYLKALVNLAGLHLRRTDTAAAAELMGRAEGLAGRDDAVFLGTRAALRRQQGDAARAIQDARRAAEVAPAAAAVWEELGLCLLMDPQRVEESVTASARALELEPSRVMAAHNLAAALDQMGRPEEALPHASRALAAQPDDPQLQQTKACILLHLGRAGEAMPLLTSVERVRPEHFEAQYNLACGLAKTGRLEEAVEHVRRALALVPPQQQRAFRAHIPNDPDLASLRSLSSFRALL